MIPNWDQYFLRLLPHLATRSKDIHTQTAAIIVGPDNSIRSTGYNSFPRGIVDTIPERLERPEKYNWIEHGERNAIYAAAKSGVSLDGCRIYARGYPCVDCARAVIQVGIREFVYDLYRHLEWAKTTPKYEPDFKKVEQMLWEAGVNLRGVVYAPST